MATAQVELRRLWALCRKEFFQIIRDPSSIMVAFVLPVMLMFIFAFGLNLDSDQVPLGLVLEDSGPEARDLAQSFSGTRYFNVKQVGTRQELAEALTNGSVRGFVVVPADFSRKLALRESSPIQVITDGSEPSLANFVSVYAQGVWSVWIRERAQDAGTAVIPALIESEPRFWYNPSAISRNYLIPGSITIIMTVVGALLTSLVVAREWERGTMEALLAAGVNRGELLLSKLIPYFVLGMGALFVCWFVTVFLLSVPFRGSLFVLMGVGAIFLLSALGLGLLISTVMRNQFNAAQATLNAAFLPATMLSGLVFEISSMPTLVQFVTQFVPARYFVPAIQTIFQAGDLFKPLLKEVLFLIAAAVFFLGLTALKTRRRLE
ncbi:MAG: ABC transporter permease [Puniceicoccales bacterium]|jgi:ABC-2 type transport system permease protein|nr:ABC transporter permease [Puniceicoccales bacterium]